MRFDTLPKTAMIMAAGQGVRMRPITDHIPKPLVSVAGRTMIDRAIDRLVAVGVLHIVVNIQYRGDQIRDHLAGRDDVRITLIDEGDAALETGGGVVNALPVLGDKPFFIVNADSVWIDGPVPMLERLGHAWQPGIESVLLLHPADDARGDPASRDFYLDVRGAPMRPVPDDVVAYTFAGVQLASPTLFRDPPAKAFSTNVVWNRAQQTCTLRALVHDGIWYHIGTVPGLERAEVDFLTSGVQQAYGQQISV